MNLEKMKSSPTQDEKADISENYTVELRVY